MKTKNIYLLVVALSLMGFIAVVAFQQGRSLTNAQAAINNHARIISRSLWNLEPRSPTAYLNLAASANHYETITVRDEKGRIFVELSHAPATLLDKALLSVKLMRRLRLQAPIDFNGTHIGTIEATWLQKTTYSYIYIFTCLLLLLVVVWLFFKLIDVNRTLEDKVHLRTAELEQEIGERRLAEERAVKMSQRLAAHQHQTPVGLIEWDLEFRVIEWNPAAEKIFGFTRQEALGKTAHELIVPAQRKSQADRLWRQLLDRSGGDGAINENITKSGQTLTCEWRNTTLAGADGEIIGVASIVQDITERRQTEKEMRRLRNHLRNIIDAMPSILVGVDIKCHVTLWNNAAQSATGVAVADALGDSLENLLPRMQSELTLIQTAMAEGRIHHTGKIARRLGSELRYEDVTIIPLAVDGEKGAVIRIDDITERVRMEDTLVQSEKMLSVGGLAAGMAHEINNPLAGMMQSVSVVQQRLSANLPANTRAAEASGISLDAVRAYMRARGIPAMLTAIHTEGHRAAGIVQNMLSFARKRDDNWTHHDLADLLDAAVELASTDYDLKKKYDFRLIEIVRAYDPDMPPVPCEKQMIQQVFLNILRNGAEAMQSGGTSEGARFILRISPTGKMARVEIEDNGPGMDDTTRRRVFEPFFTTKPVGVGTGLGLSVSYFIVTENHRGRLKVETPAKGGTRFVICLPFAAEAYPSAAAPTESTA